MPNSGISLPKKDTEGIQSESMATSMLDSVSSDPNQCLDHEEDGKNDKKLQDCNQQEEEKEQQKGYLEQTEEKKCEPLAEKSVERDEVRRRRGAKGNSNTKCCPVQKSCPAAPRKPKSRKISGRCWFRRSMLVDLSKEVESMFPPHVLQDFGKKIKKARS